MALISVHHDYSSTAVFKKAAEQHGRLTWHLMTYNQTDQFAIKSYDMFKYNHEQSLFETDFFLQKDCFWFN